MKKYLFIVLVLAGLLTVTVSMASANAGPHGGYTATTDACAGCHRAHTASGPKLLVQSSTYALCMSCHGSTATGADTNVEDGYFLSTRSASTSGEAATADNASLLGGGFLFYGGTAVSSTHDATGATAAAWGNGVDRGTTGALATNLTCASCHDPHGSTNYRIIKETVNGAAVSVADPVAAQGDYDTENWGAGMSNICAACHQSYHETAANVGSNSTAWAYNYGAGTYTHRVDMSYVYGTNANPETVGYTDAASNTVTVPLAETGTNDTVVCSTCHLSHGTSASMTGFAAGAGPAGDSALLRLDNRGVCEACHQK